MSLLFIDGSTWYKAERIENIKILPEKKLTNISHTDLNNSLTPPMFPNQSNNENTCL